MRRWSASVSCTASFLLACGGPVVTGYQVTNTEGDPSGPGSFSTTISDNDDDDSSTASAESTTAVVDMGAPGIEPTELCPPMAAVGIGLDTSVRLTFASASTPQVADPNAVQLACAAQSIAGSVTTAPGAIVFEPAEALPTNASCDVTVGDAAVMLDGVDVPAVEWSFTTGAQPGVEFGFRPPVVLSSGHALNVGAADAEGEHVVIVWTIPSMSVARSSDRGEHFETSVLDPVSGSTQSPDLDLQGGIVHVVWQVLDSKNDGQIYYSRSDPELGDMSEPLHMNALPYSTSSTMPSVTSDGDSLVLVTWQEECSLDPTCELADAGVYMATSADAGESFAEPVQLADGLRLDGSSYFGTELGWVDGGAMGVTTRISGGFPDTIEVLDLEMGFETIATIEGSGYGYVERISDTEAAATWLEGAAGQPQQLMLMRLRGRTSEGVDAPRVIAEPTGGDLFATIDLIAEIVAMVSAESDEEGSYPVRLSLSTDGGETFSAPQPLHAIVPQPPDVAFPKFPTVAVADDQRAHLAWSEDGERETSVMYTHGDRIAPCSLGTER
jgi:hypothetical protein